MGVIITSDGDFLECDDLLMVGCKARTERFVRQSDISRHAQGKGWIIRDNGRTICPICRRLDDLRIDSWREAEPTVLMDFFTALVESSIANERDNNIAPFSSRNAIKYVKAGIIRRLTANAPQITSRSEAKPQEVDVSQGAEQVTESRRPEPKNIEAVRAWVTAHRSDLSHHFERILCAGPNDDRAAALLLVCMAGFEAGREFQRANPNAPEDPSAYLV